MPWSRQLASALAVALVAPLLVSAQNPVLVPAKFTVVLDAAHGGDETGAQLASGVPEKTATLALSARLRSLLAARGFGVVTTRDTDTALDPDRRAAIANHANAGACLIVHFTASGSGVHIFTSALTPRPAERFLPWKTAQSAFVARSVALSGLLNSTLTQTGITVTLGSANLSGLDSMTCPAVAIEIAPERGPNGAIISQPFDPDYETRVASALAASLLTWRQQERAK